MAANRTPVVVPVVSIGGHWGSYGRRSTKGFSMVELQRATSDSADEVALYLSEIAPFAAVIVEPIEDRTAELFPQELEVICRSVAKRRHEFSSGRTLAREALNWLGHVSRPILVGDNREPLWPEGTIGSLSHSHGLCAVVTAHTTDVRTLGLDIEWVDDVSTEIMSNISTSAEITLNQHEVHERELAACLFSIREALFKAYNPVTNSFLDFLDVELRLDGGRGMFNARLTNPARPLLLGRSEMSGRFAVVHGFAVAIVATDDNGSSCLR